jgi:hypothetical protein
MHFYIWEVGTFTLGFDSVFFLSIGLFSLSSRSLTEDRFGGWRRVIRVGLNWNGWAEVLRFLMQFGRKGRAKGDCLLCNAWDIERGGGHRPQWPRSFLGC